MNKFIVELFDFFSVFEVLIWTVSRACYIATMWGGVETSSSHGLRLLDLKPCMHIQ